ncbi:unnamed protein product [Urochloa humidicola]
MAPNPSAVAIKAANDGNLRLLKKMVSEMDLREAKDNVANVLHCAAAKGHLEMCRFLVKESGVDVNSTDTDGKTTVALAAGGGKMSVLRYFLDRGGDPRMADAEGDTPLHDAADGGAFVPPF